MTSNTSASITHNNVRGRFFLPGIVTERSTNLPRKREPDANIAVEMSFSTAVASWAGSPVIRRVWPHVGQQIVSPRRFSESRRLAPQAHVKEIATTKFQRKR